MQVFVEGYHHKKIFGVALGNLRWCISTTLLQSKEIRMGFMANTLSMYQYTVKGDLPKDNMGSGCGSAWKRTGSSPLTSLPDPVSGLGEV